MNTAVQIDKSIFQSRFVLAPRHAVHAWSRILLQGFVTLPQQIQRHMMQQSSEPLFLPFLRRSAHAAQPLGHPFPALCRTVVGLCVVLLGPLPSLHYLRRGLLLCVQQLHRYYAAVRLLQRVRVRRLALSLCGPVCLINRRAAGLPVLVHVVSRRAQGLRPRRVPLRLAILSPVADSAFHYANRGGTRFVSFRGSISRPAEASFYASPYASRRTAQDQGQNRVAAPFL